MTVLDYLLKFRKISSLESLEKMYAIQIAGSNQVSVTVFLTGPFKTQNEYHD